MKIKILVLVIIALCVAPLSYATPPCIWCSGVFINEDYNGKGIVAKCVISPICEYEIYKKTTTKSPLKSGELSRLARYNPEAENRLFITLTENEKSHIYYILFKFNYDKHGRHTTLIEAMWSEAYFPDEINPNDSNYLIYYWRSF